MTTTTMTPESRYEAVRSRDARFDGEFFFAVSTTGIYCRPSCPATTPKRENVGFYPSAAAAQAAGFRACRRCRPDAVPGSAAWNVRADMVGRAMRLISDGVVDEEGVPGLARRLGYSARQVQRQLVAEVGAGPLALARAQRAHAARVLLQTTDLSAADIAFAAGFASIRQFNETIRDVYAATPTQLRATPTKPRTPVPASTHESATGIPLRLAYRGPYTSRQVFDVLQQSAAEGVEAVGGEPGRRVYRRTLRLAHGIGFAQVNERPGGNGWLDCVLDLEDLRDLTAAIGRMRRLFDLDADPYAVAESFHADPVLGPRAAAEPGLRAPSAADPHQLALQAVLTRHAATTAEARRLTAALVAAHGDPLPAPRGALTHLFPTAHTLAEANLDDPALKTLAQALADGSVHLDPGSDRDEAEHALTSIDGISPRTAAYIRMRALGDPDVLLDTPHHFAETDTESWRPWRSYATHYLQQQSA